MVKRERHGRAKILSQNDIEQLFTEGLQTKRDRALFGFALYTAARINETCTMLSSDVYDRQGRVRPELVIRKGNTKRQLASRTIPAAVDLEVLLSEYYPEAGELYLFPGRWSRGHIHPDAAGLILRAACKRIELEGVSTHSFRRTALTQMSDNCTPLRVIAQISGHRNLSQLHAYLEVRPEQVRGAIAGLTRLGSIGKVKKDDVAPPPVEETQMKNLRTSPESNSSAIS